MATALLRVGEGADR